MNYGAKDIGRWAFIKPEIPQEWADHLGNLPKVFRMYVSGEGGHGKTEYLFQVSKMTATHIGKTHINNLEEGKHEHIQEAWLRNNIAEIPGGKWMYGKGLHNFEDYKAFLRKRNSCRVAIVDSISFWELNYANVKELFEEFPNKSFIIVGYGAHWNAHKAIRHLCDIKVKVQHFRAESLSRFGGMKPHIIFQEGYDKALRRISPSRGRGLGGGQKSIFD